MSYFSYPITVETTVCNGFTVLAHGTVDKVSGTVLWEGFTDTRGRRIPWLEHKITKDEEDEAYALLEEVYENREDDYAEYRREVYDELY